jgi:asparagine synthase (glutamine-hydrolysing)
VCGIAGFLHLDAGQNADELVLRRMTEAIVRRGPDGEGAYFERNLALGHRRLSIIDVAGGSQPMTSGDGSLVIVFNGEIYNYLELMDDLRRLGHQFKSNSDTEVLLEGYAEWGLGIHDRLNGMWAFALWDRNKRRLVLSRDRLGEKPLYYAVHNNTLVFGSELKCLLAYGMPREPDLSLSEIFLSFGYIPAPYSFIKGTRKLEAGQYLIADGDRITYRKYWELPTIDERHLECDRAAVHGRFEELLSDSVRLRMRSDVAFGAFLSGGLDSASIVTLMTDHSRHPLETFTVGFREKDYDESDLAKSVAQKVGSHHHEQIVESSSLDAGITEVLDACDEPFGDPAVIPTALIAQYARQHVKMVLTGDGGDEVLSGYNSYQSENFAALWHHVPAALRHTADGALALMAGLGTTNLRLRARQYRRVLQTSLQPFQDRLYTKAAYGPPDIVQRLVAPLGRDVIAAQEYLSDFMRQCPYRDSFYRMMYYHLKLTLPDQMLAKVDRMTMRHSLEARVPFLDHRLVEYMLSVSKTVKMRALERKSVLRSTVGRRLPPALLRARKRGFAVPLRLWFGNEPFVRRFGKLRGDAVGGLDMRAAQPAVLDNAAGKADYGNFIWMMMVYAGWFSV